MPEVRYQVDQEPAPQGVPARTWTALILLALGTAGMAGGMSWWVHPGAGVAILGAALFVIALVIGRE